MIPARIIRTIPEHPPEEAERFWQQACDLHPGWEHVTYQDPMNPDWWPLTAKAWPLCKTGAQFAGLIRLEALYHGGGIYIDSDLELFRSLEPLRSVTAFAMWEDNSTVPDFVLGAEPKHPAIAECLELALERIRSDSGDWRAGNGAWATGPGVTTTVLPGRDDVLLLPPATFAPYHYSELAREHEDFSGQPFTFGAHRWRHSWEGH